jgi:hypothetical protein
MPSSPVLRYVYLASLWVYSIGYSVYLFAAGWSSWPKMAFWDWFTHISYESVYALAWPVLLIMSWLGYR